jgi:hypothetical protein
MLLISISGVLRFLSTVLECTISALIQDGVDIDVNADKRVWIQSSQELRNLHACLLSDENTHCFTLVYYPFRTGFPFTCTVLCISRIRMQNLVWFYEQATEIQVAIGRQCYEYPINTFMQHRRTLSSCGSCSPPRTSPHPRAAPVVPRRLSPPQTSALQH